MVRRRAGPRIDSGYPGEQLQNLQTTDEKDLGQFLLSRLIEAAIPLEQDMMRKSVTSIIRTSGLLLLLDGLDQVSSDDYARVSLAIKQLSVILAAQSNRNQILLTMRYQFHLIVDTDLHHEFPLVLSLNRFTPTDVYLFLKRWPFAAEADSNAARIFDELTDSPSLKQLCMSPLILAMYVAEDQAPGGASPTPDSRTAFYTLVVNELLIRRMDRQRQRRRGHVAAAILDQREKLLGEISYRHLCDISQSANWIDWKMCVDVVKRHLTCDDNEAAKTLREISIETGIVTEERAEEKVSFIHLTFCEYLAGHFASTQTEAGWRDLLDVHRGLQSVDAAKARFLNVIPFAAGLLINFLKVKAVSQIDDLDIETQIQVFLETKQYEQAEWFDLVAKFEQQLSDLLSAASGNESDLTRIAESWSHRVYILLVAMEDAIAIAHATKRPGCLADPGDLIRRLFEHSRASTFMLLALAAQDASSALRLADRFKINICADLPELVVQNADQPAFFATILNRASEFAKTGDAAFADWAILMAESALYSPAVAARLHYDPSVDIWTKASSKLVAKNLWSHPPQIPRTALTEVISLGRAHALQRGRTFPLLDRFSTITPAGGINIKNTWLLTDPFLVVLYFCFGIGLGGSVFGILVSINEFALGVLAGAGIAIIWLYKVLREIRRSNVLYGLLDFLLDRRISPSFLKEELGWKRRLFASRLEHSVKDFVVAVTLKMELWQSEREQRAQKGPRLPTTPT